MNRKQRRAAKKQSQQVSVNGTDLFSQGVACHQQGDLDKAEALYRKLLANEPKHAEGWYHLGGIAYQKRQWADAIEYLQKALNIVPDYAEALNILGVAYKNLGQLDDAHQQLSKAIALQPNFPDALCNLGNVLMTMGQLEDAKEHYQKAITLNPNFVLALSNLGAALLKLRRWDEAIEHLKKAISLSPHYAEAHNNLGVAYKELYKNEQAIECYQNALMLNPDYGDAHNNLGNAFVALGRYEESLEHFQRAIALGLGTAEVITNLGTAYHELGRYEEALTHYQQALAANPGHAATYNNMGNSFNLQGRPEDAITYYQKALEQAPDFAEAYHNIGVVHSEQGRINDALKYFKQSIANNPHYTLAYRNIGSLHKYDQDDEFSVLVMQAAQNMDALSDEEKMHLHYALGKYYGDTGDYDRAFSHYNSGASLKRTTLNFDPDMIEAAFKGVIQFFETGDFFHTGNRGCTSHTPVFILGMPRSGTTLVEQILAAHSQVHGAGELKEFDQALNGFRVNQNIWDSTTRESQDLASRGQNYVNAVQKLDPAAQRITDKMPFNFMNIGLIHLALPNATIIHCKRDPIDTCLSNFFTYFAEPIDWSYNLEEIGRFYSAYAHMMEQWHRMLPGKIIDVQYEDIVANLYGQAHRLIEQCGLPWEEACLSFQKAKRTVRTASSGQVRKPIYTSSVQRWRRYEAHLGPLLEALSPVLSNAKAA
ncbi:MAG: tetratricopeptide repeat protein [Rhodospirillaceae bacterium]|jgi:tetratricopeptide (TPR) repeat protein